MAENILDYPLPRSLADLLMTMIEMSERNQVVTLRYTPTPSTETRGALVYTLYAGMENKQVVNLYGDPVIALDALELIRAYDDDQIFLTAKAFDWAAYQRKRPIRKWFARLSELEVVAIVTVTLALLQILQIALQLNGWIP